MAGILLDMAVPDRLKNRRRPNQMSDLAPYTLSRGQLQQAISRERRHDALSILLAARQQRRFWLVVTTVCVLANLALLLLAWVGHSQ